MEDLGHKFRQIDKLFKFRMDKNLENLNLTFSQMHVLRYLEHHENEKVTQKILAQEFQVKHSTMSGILQRMQEKGLITITVDEENKKYKNIVRTKKADEIKYLMDAHRESTEAVLTQGFTEEEAVKLSEFLDRIFDNLMDDIDIDESQLERRHKIRC